jgi:hypothetical protein
MLIEEGNKWVGVADISYRCHRLQNNVNDLKRLLSDLWRGDEIRAEKAVVALIEAGQEALPALLDLTHSSASDVDSCWWSIRTLAQSPLC